MWGWPEIALDCALLLGKKPLSPEWLGVGFRRVGVPRGWSWAQRGEAPLFSGVLSHTWAGRATGQSDWALRPVIPLGMVWGIWVAGIFCPGHPKPTQAAGGMCLWLVWGTQLWDSTVHPHPPIVLHKIFHPVSVNLSVTALGAALSTLT